MDAISFVFGERTQSLRVRTVKVSEFPSPEIQFNFFHYSFCIHVLPKGCCHGEVKYIINCWN